MASAGLPRPGVEVIQVFRTTSPTVVTPTLVPCVVGVGKEVIEVLSTGPSGASVLNGDALVTLPAFFVARDGVGSPPRYAGLGGAVLALSINHGPLVTVPLSDPTGSGLTAATVVSQIQRAFTAAGVTAATAEIVAEAAFRVRTVGVGEFQSIFVDPATTPAVLTAFGIGAGKTYTGLASYRQYGVRIPATSFPAPRGNLDELGIEPGSVRVFVATGSGANVEEFRRDQTVLRSSEVDHPAVVTGSVDLTTLTLPADLAGQTLVVRVDGGSPPQFVPFSGAVATPSDILQEIEAATTGVTATLTPQNELRLATESRGTGASLQILFGTANTALGLSAVVVEGTNIQAVDDGNGDVFTSLLYFAGHNFRDTGRAAVVTGTVNLTTLTLPSALVGLTLELSGGEEPQTITFGAVSTAAEILEAINVVMAPAAGGAITATLGPAGELVLTHALSGEQSLIQVLGGNSLTTLGLVAGVVRGEPSHVEPGDELWIDGRLVGLVVQVAPGLQEATLKVNQSVVISSNAGKSFHIVAKGLSATPDIDRPLPDLIVEPDGSARLKHEVLRDVNGRPLGPESGRAPIYLSYSAVRRDVSPRAKNPGLLRIDSIARLEGALSPVSARNPLALGLFFALINAPGVEVTGLGVDRVSADAPFGTVEAFTRAAEFLEAFETYAIAPLTHDLSVAQVFRTHVGFMSEPEQKGERIVLFNPRRPTERLDTLVASGTNGNSVGGAGLGFDTGVTNLSALLLNAGINPTGTIPVSAGVFLDIASDDKRYSVESVTGSQITIRTAFGAGENEDGYYSTTALNASPLPNVLVGETFAVRIRGTPLKAPDGTPDRQAIAEAYQALGETFQSRRFWMTGPDTVAATLGGVEQAIPGFYMNAAIAGMIAQQPPQQSFTNFPMAGFTRVIGSSDFFSERQMNLMAAGGTYLIVQDSAGAPLVCRHALTTDLTSIETRTDSITKIVDFVAKFLRRGVRNFVGRFNITQGFLDALGSVIQGLLGFLVENGILISASLNNIIQDEDAPDTVLIDVTLDVPYPANYIRLTLLI
jgi:hypothetical protein